MHDSSKTIRVALQGEFPVGSLSPENISTIALYHLHYNLWDNLLAPGGKPALAKTHRVSPDNLAFTFEIDPEAKFSNGRPITARDVKEAFERIIAREENGHINAKSVIREIRAGEGGEGTLRILLNAPTPSFLFLLTTPEFGIVPRESLDASGEVTNLAVTSGAYVAKQVDAKSQKILLIKNKYFRRAEPHAPERIELDFNESMGADSPPGNFDFAEVRSSDAEAIVSEAEKKGFGYKATVPSLSVYMVAKFDLLTAAQRTFIAQAFRDHFQFETPRRLELRSHQFLPEKTFGSLSPKEISEILTPKAAPGLPSEIVISNNRSTGPLVDAVRKVFAQIGTKAKFVGVDTKEAVHYELTSQGMNTEFPEIELHLVTVGPYAFFNASEQTKRMVGMAMHQADDKKRSELFKSIGRDFLITGKVIPLTVRAYVHLFNASRLDLNNITNYDGDIPLYKLKVLP